MKYIVHLFRLLVGGLFIFSGVVKAIDPLGTAYKMMEYFLEFGMNFMEPLSVSFAVFMIVFEIVLGVTLLLGYLPKLTTWSLLLMVIFFTFLTGYTSITGNVTDCGCFGDFLKLKPIESFTKDLVLLFMIAILFWKMKYIKPLINDKINLGLTIVTTIAFFIFCFSNYIFGLPMVDFRPYALGNNIPEQRIGVDAIVEYGFIYKNSETGEEKEFAASNLPSAPWEYSDRTENVIKEGIPAKVENFGIDDEIGDDISDQILENEGYTFMAIAYDLDNTSIDGFRDVNKLVKDVKAGSHDIFAVSAVDQETAKKYATENELDLPFYYGDPTFLKTIIRANPGLILIKNGSVINKWHHKDIPTIEDLNKILK